jgi:hypothetical protein
MAELKGFMQTIATSSAKLFEEIKNLRTMSGNLPSLKQVHPTLHDCCNRPSFHHALQVSSAKSKRTPNKLTREKAAGRAGRNLGSLSKPYKLLREQKL